MEDSELWLPQYAQQMETRSSVLQASADYLQPHSSAEMSQVVAQHPQLAAQLSQTFSDQFPAFSSTLSHPNQLLAQRPSVVQQTSSFEGFNPQQLFPFPQFLDFGLHCNDIDSRFQQHAAALGGGDELHQHNKDASKTFGHDELLFNQLNQFPYSQMSLEAMLKEKKPSTIKQEPISFSTPELPPRVIHECQVCQTTQANGLHFGARTCAACAAFFRRTISDDKKYVCKRSQRCNNPQKDSTGYRKICRACRLKRCMDIGMLPENVQHKRTRLDSPSRFDGSRTIETRTIDTRTLERRIETRTISGALSSSSYEGPLEPPRPLDPANFGAMLPFYNHLTTTISHSLPNDSGLSSSLI